MLEGWEWIIIIGGIAFSMFVVLIVALLYFFTKQKTIPQGYAPQQYSQQVQSQYNHTVNKICPQCGLSMASNAKFCSNCGKQFE
jgi:hypothetical protein